MMLASAVQETNQEHNQQDNRDWKYGGMVHMKYVVARCRRGSSAVI
jgi:hypothetical protein